MPRRLRVLVDAVQDSAATSGTDRTVRDVLGRLPALMPEADFVVGVRAGSPEVAESVGAAGTVRLVPTPLATSRRLWLLATMPALAARFRPDVTLGFYNCALPPVGGGRQVATVHDLITFRLAEEYYPDPKLRFAVQAVMRRSLHRADAIRAISDFTARDLADFGGTDAHVAVSRPGPDARFRPAAAGDVERVREKYQLPQRFLLTLGSREPRKNLAGAVAVHAALPAGVRDGVPLVVAGAPWTRAGADATAGSGLREVGFVDDADLPALYTAATVFVFLSRYEGFGLPPVEAMACGTPVVCSSTTSLPEATGGAADLVDPGDAAAGAAAVGALLADPALHAARRAAGLAWAQGFSPSEAAEGYAALVRWVA